MVLQLAKTDQYSAFFCFLLFAVAEVPLWLNFQTISTGEVV